MNLHKRPSLLFQAVALVFSLLFFCGCTSSRELKNLQKCDFAFVNVSDFEYAGVRFNDIRSINDIGAENVTRIIAAAVSQKSKTSFNINVRVTNPTASRASVDGMNWILFMDDEQLLAGNLPQPFAVEPHSSAIMALRASLVPSIRGKAAPLQQIFRFYLNIMGFDTDASSNLTLKIKPIINKTELPSISLKLN